eukprot:4244631-Pyramimonas_sp.AAC.1
MDTKGYNVDTKGHGFDVTYPVLRVRWLRQSALLSRHAVLGCVFSSSTSTPLIIRALKFICLLYLFLSPHAITSHQHHTLTLLIVCSRIASEGGASERGPPQLLLGFCHTL